MSTNPLPESDNLFKKVIHLTLQLGVVAFILIWCIQILLPFFSPIIWGIIIAITTYPLFNKLKRRLGNRGKLASILITLFFLALIIMPVIFLADSLIDGVRHFKDVISTGEAIIPPPGENTNDWPAFAKPLVSVWQAASENLQSVMVQYKSQFMDAGKFIFGLIAKTGIGVLQFVVSIILAGVFLIYATEGGNTLKGIFVKLAGEKGDELAQLSEEIIRSVVKGIVGVAVIQTLMAGVGFAIAGVPAAGFWTFLCLIFAIIQVGVGPIIIPVVIYLFNTSDLTTAIIFLIWAIIIMISDNILKPLLLGRGASVPMLVVFLGAIGGFIAVGFLGLFLGAVILSLGYKLFLIWISGDAITENK